MILCWAYAMLKQTPDRRPVEADSKHGQGRADSEAGQTAEHTAKQDRQQEGANRRAGHIAAAQGHSR